MKKLLLIACLYPFILNAQSIRLPYDTINQTAYPSKTFEWFFGLNSMNFKTNQDSINFKSPIFINGSPVGVGGGMTPVQTRDSLQKLTGTNRLDTSNIQHLTSAAYSAGQGLTLTGNVFSAGSTYSSSLNWILSGTNSAQGIRFSNSANNYTGSLVKSTLTGAVNSGGAAIMAIDNTSFAASNNAGIIAYSKNGIGLNCQSTSGNYALEVYNKNNNGGYFYAAQGIPLQVFDSTGVNDLFEAQNYSATNLFGITHTGLAYYNADLASEYTLRSLPDKNYVDSAISKNVVNPYSDTIPHGKLATKHSSDSIAKSHVPTGMIYYTDTCRKCKMATNYFLDSTINKLEKFDSTKVITTYDVGKTPGGAIQQNYYFNSPSTRGIIQVTDGGVSLQAGVGTAGIATYTIGSQGLCASANYKSLSGGNTYWLTDKNYVDSSKVKNISWIPLGTYSAGGGGTATRTGNNTFTIASTTSPINYAAKGTIIKWTHAGVQKCAMVAIPPTGSNPYTFTIVGDTIATSNPDANSMYYFAAGDAQAYAKLFTYAGTVGATGTDVVNDIIAMEPYRVLGVDMWVGTAGTTNSTSITVTNSTGSVNEFGTVSLASTVAYSSTPTNTAADYSWALGDRISLNITAVQTTPAIDLYVLVYVFPTRLLNLP